MEIIDMHNYKYNYDIIKQRTNSKIIPVVKANAYGLGVIEVMKCLTDAKLVAVNSVEEAKKIRSNNFNNDLLILSKIPYETIEELDEIDGVIITITSLEDIKNIENKTTKNGLRIHLYIDTAMNRFGFKSLKEFKIALEKIKSDKFIFEGVYTHITSIENFSNQIKTLNKYLKICQAPLVHVCASNSYLDKRNLYNASRIGLDIINVNNDPQMKEVVKVVVNAVEIRKVFKGESVGYFEKFKATKTTYIAILPIGYSNGFSRNLTGYTLYSKGKSFKIVGNICMNHIFLEVDRNFKLSDQIEVISNNNTLEKMAKFLNTIPGEILTRLNLNKIYNW